MATHWKPRCQNVDGFLIGKVFSPECFREAVLYKPRPDDYFIVTFPKCGTTWSQSILLNLFRKGAEITTFQEFQAATPFLEMLGVEVLETMRRPGAIKTHLPFHLQPYSPDAKYIYVARNPKDCCVSFYHHTMNLVEFDTIKGTFDEFFEFFIRGETPCGDYFEHVMSWYEHRNEPNVLFLTYEEMKKNTPEVILKMAAFLGEEYTNLFQADPTLMDTILHRTSFKYMKEKYNTSLETLFVSRTDEEIDQMPISKGFKHVLKYTNKFKRKKMRPEVNFVRKGVVGDWRSLFSPQQSKRVDERFAEVFGHTELADLWRKDMEL